MMFSSEVQSNGVVEQRETDVSKHYNIVSLQVFNEYRSKSSCVVIRSSVAEISRGPRVADVDGVGNEV